MILVVDEYENAARALVRLFRSHGYAAEFVKRGAAALEFVRRHPVAVVIAEYEMPEMDGQQLLTALKADPKTARIAVVLLSARAPLWAAERAMSAGAAAWMDKGH